MAQEVRTSPLLGVAEAVERLSALGVVVSEETVRHWARTGRIRRVRLPGGRYFFRPEDVDALATPVEPVSAA